MKLPEQIQFQGSAESKGFRPVEQASPTELIDREATKHLDNQQRNLARIHENLTAVEQSKVVSFNNGFKNLAAFSQTIATKLEEDKKKQNEEEMNRGLMRAYEEGVPVAEVAEYEANKEQMRITELNTTNVALNYQKSGAPFEVVDRLKGMSKWERWGYAQGKAKLAGEGYPLWVQDQLRNDNTTEITLPDGSVITPVQAAGDPAKQAAAIAQLRQKYFQENMLVGMNPALLNEHAFPNMRKAEQMLLSKTRQDFNINRSAEELEASNNQLADGTLDMTSYMGRVATTLDENGTPRGYSGAWDAFAGLVTESADAGMPLDLEALGAQIDPETGKTYRERFKRKWALLEEKQREHLRGNWADFQADQDTQFSQAEQTAIDGVSSAGNYTNAEIEAIQQELTRQYGRRSTRLDEMKNVTLEADQARQIEAQLKYKAENGLLTPDDLRGLPLELQEKYGRLADSQSGAASAIGGYKPYMDTVEGLVKGALEVSPDKIMGGMAALAVAELQTEWKRSFTNNVNRGADPLDAARQATKEVMDMWAAQSVLPGSKFFIGDVGKGKAVPDPGKEFPNLLPKGGSNAVLQKEQHFTNRLKESQETGKHVFDIAGSVMNKAELEALGDGVSKPLIVPPFVQYLSNKYNKSPFEIINSQRKAADLPELGKTPSIEATETLTPRAQQLINQFPSTIRSSRAWSTSGTFNEAIVPMGLGKEIAKAAAANGVDPALVAAVIDWENRGNWSNKTSKSGAKGIAQFMPDTAKEFGVNVNDPVSSVQGAAKYLKWLIDYFQGDKRLAIIAYNSGPGAVSRAGGAIPGSSESQEYYPGVMRAYAKYSGTPRVAMRGRFQVQGQSGYVGSTNVVATGQQDQGRRPIQFSPPAASAWQRMISAGMPFSPGNVASSYRTEQDYLRIQAQGNNPAANSLHNHGEAIDAHGSTGAWIRKHGHKYGWYPNDYQGSHGGHYEFRG